jgi:mannan endo-1,4-beta-mannosidase
MLPLLSLSLGATAFLQATPTVQAGGGFVTRCGIHFCIDGNPNNPFYFAGTNTYDVFTYGDGSSTSSTQDIETKYMDKARIDAHFAQLQQDKVMVQRLWMFNHQSWHGFEMQKGVYNEPEFMLFDYVIQSAKTHNIRLIPTFENYWEAYGGIDTRLSWEGLATGQSNRWRFFNKSLCPGCFTSYQNYVSYALNRVNHYSGIAYKNDPTIFAWELMNEPRYENATPDESTTGTTFRAWVDTMGSFIKGIDSNHMLSTGSEAQGSEYGYGSNNGTPFVYIHQSPYIDFTSAHVYPTESWANLSLAQTRSLISTYISDSHNKVGKPFFFGEFNTSGVDRTTWWNGIYSEIENDGGDGSAFWWYEDHNVDSTYGVMAGAPELGAFRQHSTNMQAKNGTVSSTTTVAITTTTPVVTTTTPTPTTTTPVPTTTTPVVTATTPVGTTNVALHKTATSSSDESSSLAAANAIDGSAGTRWSSNYSDPQWLQIDLGANYNISQVILRWEVAYGKAYSIQTSNDASNWSNIYSTSSGVGGSETLNVNGSGRYIRMYGTARGTSYGYSLWEFEVYGSPATTTTTPVITTTTPAVTTTTPVATTTTPTPTTTVVTGQYSVQYGISSQWNTGYNVSVTIVNNGSTPVNNWTISWSLAHGETLASSWNAQCSISGNTITCSNANYNATLGANGGSQNFGIQFNSTTGATTIPTAFTVNGVAIH